MYTVAEGISLKLFIGIPLNSELKLKLAQSKTWQESLITGTDDVLKIVRFGEKEYFGRYLPHSHLLMSELPPIESSLIASIKHYCPRIKHDKLVLRIFSQPFIH